ncbi:hypothetical protein BD410DRAFT_785087 [Rickenella mellea]|uniref:Large ribosomal subunit protein mL59 domain-containing protein n=1 Tax=Rickenella mellea TaxID=50990 RepID=A0A4Y7QC04_9AGAM|nr:hypothetical protein BD410DRAFT_785087 [Rickenella mellea]
MSSQALQLIKRFRSRELLKALPGAWESTPRPQVALQNPFLPWFNPKSKRWHPPVYSRRRQAELVKKARETGLVGLLPLGPKMGVGERAAWMGSMRESTRTLVEETSAKSQLHGREEAVQSRSAKAILHNPAIIDTHASVNISWQGTFKEKQVAGADIGARLYAGKKRMFKGHKWERERLKRRKQTSARMRDMPKRIRMFRSTYRRTRPWVLGRIIAGKEKVGI